MTPHKDEWEEEFERISSAPIGTTPDGKEYTIWDVCPDGKDELGLQIYDFIIHLLASQKKEMSEKLEIAKEPLPAITMSAKEAVSFNRGIDTAIALIQE